MSCYAFFLLPTIVNAYEIATSLKYSVAQDSLIYTTTTNEGCVVGQDHQDCREKPVPPAMIPCRHLGAD